MSFIRGADVLVIYRLDNINNETTFLKQRM